MQTQKEQTKAILHTGIDVIGDLKDFDGQLEMQIENGDGGGALKVTVDEEFLYESVERFRFAICLPTAETQRVRTTAVPNGRCVLQG